MKQTGNGETLRVIRFALSWSGLLLLALLTISPASAATSITITCSDNGPTDLGVSYQQTCTADESGPYMWQAVQLPSGLTFTSDNSNTAIISGTPDQLGGYYYQISVTGTCDTGSSLISCTGMISFEGSIMEAPLSADCYPAEGDATFGQSYTVTCTAQGALLSYYWEFPNLPDWIVPPSENDAYQQKLVLTGVPNELGTVSFAVQVSDYSSLVGDAPRKGRDRVLATAIPTVTVPITIHVHERLNLSCNSASGPVGQPVSSTCQTRGGATPYSFTSGTLPDGFMLDPMTGAISGTSATPLYTQVKVTVTDSAFPTMGTSSAVTIINITAPGILLSCANIQTSVGDAVATSPCTATNGVSPYTFSATTLPSGLTLDASTGVISGTTSAPGTFQITMTVQDSTSGTPKIATANFSIIVGAQMLSLTCSDIAGTSGKPLSATPCSVSGGTGPFSYQATGLPNGLVMNANSGIVSGSTGTVASFTVAVTVTDNSQETATSSFTVVISVPALTLHCDNQSANVGDSVSFTPCSASGGHSPYSYVATGLPSGLSMAASGSVSGTVAGSANTFTVNVTVTDTPSSGQPAQAMASFQIEVHLIVPPVQIDISGANGPSSHPTVDLNLDNAAPAALNGVLEVSFESAVGNVPSGYIDPGVQFPNGTQQIGFTVPAGQTVGQFANPAMFSPGTVAGKLHFKVIELKQGDVDVLPGTPPETTYEIPLMEPVITPGSVKITSTASGISVQLQAYSNTRELGHATVQFNAATGTNLGGNTSATVVLADPAATYFESDTGLANGSRFQVTLSFGYTGDISALGGVSVTLTNSQGTSAAVMGTR